MNNFVDVIEESFHKMEFVVDPLLASQINLVQQEIRLNFYSQEEIQLDCYFVSSLFFNPLLNL